MLTKSADRHEEFEFGSNTHKIVWNSWEIDFEAGRKNCSAESLISLEVLTALIPLGNV